MRLGLKAGFERPQDELQHNFIIAVSQPYGVGYTASAAYSSYIEAPKMWFRRRMIEKEARRYRRAHAKSFLDKVS